MLKETSVVSVDVSIEYLGHLFLGNTSVRYITISKLVNDYNS